MLNNTRNRNSESTNDRATFSVSSPPKVFRRCSGRTLNDDHTTDFLSSRLSGHRCWNVFLHLSNRSIEPELDAWTQNLLKPAREVSLNQLWDKASVHSGRIHPVQGKTN